jgi:hypothetical protein
MLEKIIFLLLLLTFTLVSQADEFMRIQNKNEIVKCISIQNDECIKNPDSKPVKITDIDKGEEKKYITDGKNIYYLHGNNYSTNKKYYYIFNGADAKTFGIIGNSFVKDKNHVYYTTRWKNIALESADPKTFEYIGESYPLVYAKDSKRVYVIEKYGDPVHIIKNAHPATFELLKENYSKDKNHIYFQEKPAKGIDVKTFEILGYFHVKDKNHVYMRNLYDYNPVKGADIETFEILTPLYTKDKNHVYYDSEIIQGADPAAFIIMETDKKNEGEYAADKKRVYYKGEVIPESDPSTFELMSVNFAKDKNHVYYKNKNYALDQICIERKTDEKTPVQDKKDISLSRNEEPYYEVKEISRPLFNNLSKKTEQAYCSVGKGNLWKILENSDPVTFEVIYEIKKVIPAPIYSSSGISRISTSYMSKDKENYYIDFYRVDKQKWQDIRNTYIDISEKTK